MKINKNVQIVTAEGKDLLIKNYRINKKTIRKGSLDDSIEVDKLKDLNKNIIKFNDKNKRYYTDDIITVTFKYACKSDSDLTDEEYERVVSLEKVKEMKLMELTNKKYDDLENIKNEIKQTDELLKLAKRQINKKDIRNQLYKYGFNVNVNGKNKHYVRYKRTSGSARVGKCLFINEEYFKDMIDWSFAGIEHTEGCNMDTAAMEAYISLPTSSAIDRFNLKPENILLIDDCYSEFEDTVMATHFVNEVKDSEGNVISGDLHTCVDKSKIKNNIFDGESLLDKSIFEEKGYEDRATLQIRNRFFKGIGINADIQKFFKDNNITKISQLNGNTIATDISQIKLITTPSSVKYLKFGEFEEWLKYIEADWAICKYEKPQHHFNGMAQTHYQLLNTLGLSKENMEVFLQDTIDYINNMKNNINIFKYQLGLNGDYIEENEDLKTNIDSTNSFILNMLDINEDFEFTKMCKNFRKDTIGSYINNVRKGHVLVEGNYSVIVSCPYEYLLASIGKFDGTSELKPFECVSNKFKIGEKLLAVRSPEPTMSNITILNNTYNKNISEYFNVTSQEVCYISPIKNNIMELLSSCDFDGDQFLITNNPYLVEAGESIQETIIINGEEIKRFLISTDFTPKSSIKRSYTSEDLADTDIKCSQNKIGEIINLAQILNSVYWDKKYNGASEEELLELYKDISNLNILSCIEIDRCKKMSPVDAQKELTKIRNKGYLKKGEIVRNKTKKEVNIRPYFFKYLDGGKDYKFKKFNTGMDYLQDILTEKIVRDTNYTKTVDLHELLKISKPTKVSRKTIDKIKNYTKELKYNYYKIFSSADGNKFELCKEVREDAIHKIKNTKIDNNIISNVIKRVSKSFRGDSIKYKDYKKVGRLMLSLLYESDKKRFIKNIKLNNKNKSILKESINGDINIYGINFEITRII